MNKAVTILALAFGFLLGVIAGPWLWPPELLNAFTGDPTTAPQEVQAVSAAPPPSPPPPPAPPPPRESELELKGVFVGGDASRALIAYGEQAPRPYKLDDKLPDGSVLKAINSKDVEVEKNGETRTLLIERGTPPAEAGEAGAADKVLVLIETEPGTVDPRVGGRLHVFEREVGSVKLYEISPREEPKVLSLFNIP